MFIVEILHLFLRHFGFQALESGEFGIDGHQGNHRHLVVLSELLGQRIGEIDRILREGEILLGLLRADGEADECLISVVDVLSLVVVGVSLNVGNDGHGVLGTHLLCQRVSELSDELVGLLRAKRREHILLEILNHLIVVGHT